MLIFVQAQVEDIGKTRKFYSPQYDLPAHVPVLPRGRRNQAKGDVFQRALNIDQFNGEGRGWYRGQIHLPSLPSTTVIAVVSPG